MTREANAAITGAFAGGATRVTVNDSHGDMWNLQPEELDARAELTMGSPKAWSMMQGIDDGHDVCLFVGYHAAAGAQDGVLAHTYAGASLYEVRLNGAAVTEAELNATLAAEHGVPVGLVTGDDVICTLAEKRLPGVRTVGVKRGMGFTVTSSMHPEVARTAITAAAEQAVRNARDLEPQRTADAPFTLEVDTIMPTGAELCSMVPGVQRVGGRTVRFTTSSYPDAYRCLLAFTYLCRAAV